DLTVGEIALDTVQAGHDELVRALGADRSDALVCDAVTPGHVAALARAAAAVAVATGEPWLSVDSGPFGAPLPAALGLGAAPRPILVIAGSITVRTAEQLAEARQILGARYAPVTELDEDTLTAGVLALLDAGASVAGIAMPAIDFDPALAERIPVLL